MSCSPDLNGDDLPEMWVGVHEDPLNKIVAELIGADLLVLAKVKKSRSWNDVLSINGMRGLVAEEREVTAFR